MIVIKRLLAQQQQSLWISKTERKWLMKSMRKKDPQLLKSRAIFTQLPNA